MKEMKNAELLAYLHNAVKPALGCTEPVCAALVCAAASHAGVGAIQSLQLTVNPGLYKNGMSVAIPHFDAVGIPYAAALGALIGDPDRELQIFDEITPQVAAQAKALVEAGRVTVTLAEGERKLYARCTLTGSEGSAVAEIRDAHTNLVRIEKNGQVVFSKETQNQKGGSSLEDELLASTVAQLRQAAWQLPAEDLEFLLEGITPNETMARLGREQPSPVGIASPLESSLGNSLMERMMKLVGDSVEARLDGCPYAVTSSAGSGSKGLDLLLPLAEAAREAHLDRDQLAHAVAFGHLLNNYINLKIGKLSAVCTCAVAASTSMSAALVALWGGTDEQIGYAINNMTGAVTGMICDGGKPGCTLKLAQSTASAYLSAKMALAGHTLRSTDGICAETPEECIRNMARIANQGMPTMDHEILDIMLHKGDHHE